MKIAIIGGGAAGFFAALAAKEHNPEAHVALFERSAKLLSKVRISGGGRCNVTHACFDPRLLVKNYPRGEKELLGPFHRFQPQDTVEWFQSRGVRLKTEADGRMFPITDSSQTIIDCLMGEAKRLGVEIYLHTKLVSMKKQGDRFLLTSSKEGAFWEVDRLILATGSDPAGWEFAKQLGHTIIPPVPSLFTFNIPSFPLVELAGVSVSAAKLKLEESRYEQEGPLLITHWGFSGPAVLRLSAFAARFLAEKEYRVVVSIDWLPHRTREEVSDWLAEERKIHSTKSIGNLIIPFLSKSLWQALCHRAGVPIETPLHHMSRAFVGALCEVLKHDQYQIEGKTTYKEEFVTCGGIALPEVEFKTMESKQMKHLFFCGEVLNIDGVTGGFNFQNAWTTGWIAGQSAASDN